MIDFISDQRRIFVWNADQQRLRGLNRFSLETITKHGSAGNIRNGEAIDHVLLAIEKCVEWEIVERPMRHDNQMAGLKIVGDGLEQLDIELVKVPDGRFLKLFGIFLNVV